MANNKIILSIYHLFFFILLFFRGIADWQNFPIDGYTEITLPSVIEYLVFYTVLFYGLIILFRYNSLSYVRSVKYALVVMTIYMFIHFFEFFFFTGGRAAVYPPNENFWVNISTAFLYTKDAGFWQIMRIFVCGTAIFSIVLHYNGFSLRSMISMLIFYFWGMLLTHPYAWLFFPEDSRNIPLDLIKQGALIYTTALYALIFLIIGSFIDFGKLKIKNLGGFKFSYLFLWSLFLILPLIPYPEIKEQNITISLIMILGIMLIYHYVFMWITNIKLNVSINWGGIYSGIFGILIVIVIFIDIVPIKGVLVLLLMILGLQWYNWKSVIRYPQYWSIITGFLTGFSIYFLPN